MGNGDLRDEPHFAVNVRVTPDGRTSWEGVAIALEDGKLVQRNVPPHIAYMWVSDFVKFAGAAHMMQNMGVSAAPNVDAIAEQISRQAWPHKCPDGEIRTEEALTCTGEFRVGGEEPLKWSCPRCGAAGGRVSSSPQVAGDMEHLGAEVHVLPVAEEGPSANG